MSDLTNAFKSLLNDSKTTTINDSLSSSSKYKVPKDTFNKECFQLWKHLKELHYLVTEVHPLYLDENVMSVSEKEDFDVEVRYQLQQYLEKLKFLEQYEQRRTEAIIKSSKSLSLGKIFNQHTNNHEEEQKFQDFLIQHRSGVLKSLQLELMDLGKDLSSLQTERLLKQKEALQVDFEQARKSAFTAANMVHDFNADPTNWDSSELDQNNEQWESSDMAPLVDVHQSPIIETTKEEVEEYEQTLNQLTQEQIQALQDDHEDLLNFKNQQLHEVEHLNKTIMDIATLQNELAIHLQTQSDTINNILDNHDTVHVDILQANKNLKKAGRAAGYSAKMVSTMAIVFGLLILFLDFIN